MSTVTIKLPKELRERLQLLALRYGLSLPSFGRRIFEELASEFPEDSFENYRDPLSLKRSFNRSISDWKAGRVYTSL